MVGGGSTLGSIVGDIVLANNAAVGFWRSDAIAYGGQISGTGSVQHHGGGSLDLNGANSFVGDVWANSATLRLGHASALGAATNSLFVSGGATVDLNGHQVGLGALNGPGTVASTNGPSDLPVGNGGGSGGFSGSFGPDIALTKAGTGVQTLSGNSALAQLAINGGWLDVSGATLTTSVTIERTAPAGFAVLAGTGSVTGSATTLNGLSYILPGDAGVGNVGVLTVGGLDMTAGGQFWVDINGTTVGTEHDRLVVTGSALLGNGVALFNFRETTSYVPQVGDSFLVMQRGAGSDGFFSGLPEAATFATGGTLFQITYFGGDGNDVLVTAIAAVPEPATLAMLGLALGGAGLAWRKRRQDRLLADSTAATAAD